MFIENLPGTFCHNVHYLREKQGLLLSELAERICMNAERLRELECADPAPPILYEHFRWICALFGVSAERIVHSDLQAEGSDCFPPILPTVEYPDAEVSEKLP